MNHLTPIRRLVDPCAWRASPVAGNIFISHISLGEAARLSEPGEARDWVEAFAEAQRVVTPGLRGLLLFVVGLDEGIAGVVEVYVDGLERYSWHGPHGSRGPLFAWS